MRNAVICAALVCTLLLAGCGADTVQPDAQAAQIEMTAAYLAPEQNAALPDGELAAHPEIATVRSMDALKAAETPQVWIDAACIAQADRDWLLSLNDVPIAVVGYGDGLYAFAERLDFPVEMPAGTVTDPDKPGFCVWMQTENGDRQRIRSFEQALAVTGILDACNGMDAA